MIGLPLLSLSLLGNFINEPADIFKLDYKKIKNIEGWGDLSVSNLKKAIDKSKKIILDKFIYSIGIRHIGQENAKTIAAFFVSIKEFSKIYDLKIRKTMLKNLTEQMSKMDLYILPLDRS